MCKSLKCSILIVEDEDNLRNLLGELLEAEGYHCVSAASCAEASEMVRTQSISCGLIDLGLPDGNGLDLLPEFNLFNPWLVPVILTGDGRAETIVKTMRAGAFDYLTKPVEPTMLRVAVARAVQHHQVLSERAGLIDELSEEREQLKFKVEEATADIRQYAERLHTLLQLTRVSEDFYTDEFLFRNVHKALTGFFPIHSIALYAHEPHEFLAGIQGKDGEFAMIASEENGNTWEFNPELAQESEDLLPEAEASFVHYTGIPTDNFEIRAYPQVFWGRTRCTVLFMLSSEFKADSACDEFLSMCAHFVASQWQEARLFLHVAHQASVGGIAMEMSRGLLQGLTAIRTSADVVQESDIVPDASKGVDIILDNVDRLCRQIREFRQIATLRKDSVETVHLDHYLDQVLELLSTLIERRNITIQKDYVPNSECVLLNGTTLARILLDLISTAVHSVDAGGRMALSITTKEEKIRIEIGHEHNTGDACTATDEGNGLSLPERLSSHPKFSVAQRSIRSCCGKLLLDQEKDGWCIFRIELPQDATNYSQVQGLR